MFYFLHFEKEFFRIEDERRKRLLILTNFKTEIFNFFYGNIRAELRAETRPYEIDVRKVIQVIL